MLSNMKEMSDVTDKTGVKVTCENGVWTRVIEPPGDTWQTFGQTLLERMKRVSERVGQIDGLTDEQDTYASMVDRSVRCALWLRKQNVKPGDFIGICTRNHLDTFVPVLAAIFTGVVFHPWWDMNLDHDMIKYFLELGEPKVVFVNENVADSVQKIIDGLGTSTKVVVFDDSSVWMTLHDILKEQGSEDVSSFECTRIEDINQPAVMVCTSGSTGHPKGVLHSYPWLEKCSYLAPDKYVMNNTILWASEISWIGGIGCTMSSLRNCSTAVIYSRPAVDVVCKLVEKYKVNCLIIVTAHANQLYKLDDIEAYDLSSLKYIIFGGGGVTQEVDKSMSRIFSTAVLSFAYEAEDLRVNNQMNEKSPKALASISQYIPNLHREYITNLHRARMTEMGAIVRREGAPGKFCCCGKIRENCQIKIVDLNRGETLGPNEEGEICLKSPYMILRYHKDPKSTAETIDKEGWYHSGDMGYIDGDGDLFIIDRLKEVIRYKIVMPVPPLVVERVILEYPDVLEAGVVAKPDLMDIELPMAFITIRTGSKVTEEEIIKHVEDNLPDHMKLRGGVQILEKMPTTPSGKISKKSLREMAKAIANES